MPTVRDVIAHAEHEKLPVCVLALDFNMRLTNSHEYLFTILRNYGLSSHLVTLTRRYIRRPYQLCKSTDIFPIHSGVRQECPLSMALYTLALHPLLTDLEHRLPGVSIGRSSRSVSVVAYADDVWPLVFILKLVCVTSVSTIGMGMGFHFCFSLFRKGS